MSWNGIAVNRPSVPSKDNKSKGGKVSFSENHESGKHVGNKGSGCHRGTATKEDFKALDLGQNKIHDLKLDKKQSFGPAPEGGVTKK